MKKNLMVAVGLSVLTLGTSLAQTRKSTNLGGNVENQTTTMAGSMSVKTNTNLAASAGLSADHSALLAALEAASLTDMAQKSGPYTVFAPTNAAFDKVDQSTMASLMQPANRMQLTQLLGYHVVRGRFLAKDLKNKQTLTTAQGGKLTVKKEDGVVTLTDAMGNTATVTMADITATNGIVHSVDTVLMPGSLSLENK